MNDLDERVRAAKVEAAADNAGCGSFGIVVVVLAAFWFVVGFLARMTIQ